MNIRRAISVAVRLMPRDSRARRSTGTARRRPILESLESRRLLASIAQYPVPSPGELPTSIIAGPDGNLWFTEGLGSEIGMINPSTHVVTQFALPENFMLVSGMTVGPDGNIWFTDYLNDDSVSFGAIGSINPTTGAIAEYPEFFPGAVPFGITAGPDGNLWFTNINNNDIGIFNPTTDAVTILPVPGSWGATGITTGPDGNIWVSLFAENAIGMINPTTYAITTFGGATDQGSPDQIVVGSDGNLWYTEAYVEDIGTINPTTGSITQIPMPSDVGGITAGPDGDLWVTIGSGNSAEIGMLNPATLALTTFPVPISGYGAGSSDPEGITLGPDGNLWFADTNGYSIGVLDASGLGVEPTSSPSPSIPAGTSFGFTLTVNSAPAKGHAAAAAGDSVSLALASVPAGDTLTVSTTAGVATYRGLMLKKHGRSFNLVQLAQTQATASASRAKIAKPHPLLVEQELTAGTGKHKHVIGVELEFSKSLDPSLAYKIAKGLTHQTNRPLAVHLIAEVAGNNPGVGLRGTAGFAPNSQSIVVVAKAN